ncbi:restriction endonuclease subunit S [Vibrio owensii]|uniref:restriction endonuclease subunit S n=1 Tax=Vibrio owensii TaxID=696485 RepID=UPI002FF078A2
MGSELIPLGDLCSKVLTGGTPLTKNKHFYEGGDIPWLKTKEVNFNFIQETENFITQEGLDGSSAKLVPINSVIVAMYGQGDTAGRVAINKVPVTTNQACCNLVIDPKKGDFRYVYYYLKHSYAELVRRKTGSAQPNLNTRILKEFEILNLPLEEQTAIGKLLEKFDLKIILNSKINQTLEQMAQTLFKSWFVDFDPVIDNALDAGSDIPEVFEARVERRKAVRESADFKPLPDDIRQLFPSEFEESELGWVPKGWKRESVSDVIQINPRVKLPKGTEAPFVEMKALPTSGYAVEEVSSKAFTGGAKFEQHDVLLARITPCLQNGKTGFVDFLNEGEVGFGSTEFIVMRQTEDVHFGYVACLARNEKFRVHAMQSMVGSSGRQRVQNSCFDSFVITLPTKDVMSMFAKMSENYFSKMRTNKLESDNLENLRDTLLPKLISGELRLDSPEVEQAKALVE